MSSGIDETAKANAKLIAAAPDLLAILEQIATDKSATLADCRNLARAALAKATT